MIMKDIATSRYFPHLSLLKYFNYTFPFILLKSASEAPFFVSSAKTKTGVTSFTVSPLALLLVTLNYINHQPF